MTPSRWRSKLHTATRRFQSLVFALNSFRCGVKFVDRGFELDNFFLCWVVWPEDLTKDLTCKSIFFDCYKAIEQSTGLLTIFRFSCLAIGFSKVLI